MLFHNNWNNAKNMSFGKEELGVNLDFVIYCGQII